MNLNLLEPANEDLLFETQPEVTIEDHIRERIQINGDKIPQSDFARLIRLVEPIVARMKPTPSYFDALTAIAFKYFAEQKVDIAIVETGLGGRLDSTNVIKPEITAIGVVHEIPSRLDENQKLPEP